MSLNQKIDQDFLAAMKNQESELVGTLRLLKSAVLNKKIEKKLPKAELLSDDEVIAVLKTEAKRRHDAIAAYEQGGRADLADKEKKELAILEKYLPAQLAPEQILAKVKEAIAESGGDAFGKVMGLAMAKMKGQADGQLVSKLVKEELAK